MKKKLVVISVLALIGPLTLLSCSSSNNNESNNVPSQNEDDNKEEENEVVEPTPEPTIEPTPEPTPEPVVIEPEVRLHYEEKTISLNEELEIEYDVIQGSERKISIVTSSRNDDVVTIENNKVTPIGGGSTYIDLVDSFTNEVMGSIKIIVEEEINEDKTKLSYTYTDYTKRELYNAVGSPTIGTSKFLIIPIWFKDSSEFITFDHRENIRKDAYKAFFGRDEDTGWKSVKSYYEEESRGRLEMNGEISEWYEVDYSYKNFRFEESLYNVIDLVNQGTKAYFENHPETNSKDFDGNGDGYIDGVIAMYACPDYSALNNYYYTNLWAYTYWTMEEANIDDPVPNAFFWSSYDFMYDENTANKRTGKSKAGSGNNQYCTIDTHTFIHEIGHVLGLQDYYDYGPNGYSAAGGFSMQDLNVGGHDPYSVMAFGWSDPYIVEDEGTFTIKTFQKSKDLVLISPKWNDFNSPFDEYILMELYSPTGLNEFDTEHQYNYGGASGVDQVGIRLWHVDSRLVFYTLNQRGEVDGLSSKSITTNPNDGVGITHAFTNTYDSTNGRGSPLGYKFDEYKTLSLLRNNVESPLRSSTHFNEFDLFMDGSYNLADYSSQFKKGDRLLFNNSESIDFSFDISIEDNGHDSTATISIHKN